MACINICLCITFLRFKAGCVITDLLSRPITLIPHSIDRLAERKILSRDDPLYIKRLFKSRWQPLPAYVGIVGCSCVVVWSGIPALYMLGAKGKLTSSNNIKSSVALAFDVVGVYIGVRTLSLHIVRRAVIDYIISRLSSPPFITSTNT